MKYEENDERRDRKEKRNEGKRVLLRIASTAGSLLFALNFIFWIWYVVSAFTGLYYPFTPH